MINLARQLGWIRNELRSSHWAQLWETFWVFFEVERLTLNVGSALSGSQDKKEMEEGILLFTSLLLLLLASSSIPWLLLTPLLTFESVSFNFQDRPKASSFSGILQAFSTILGQLPHSGSQDWATTEFLASPTWNSHFWIIRLHCISPPSKYPFYIYSFFWLWPREPWLVMGQRKAACIYSYLLLIH